MKTLKGIQFVMENCETFFVDAKDISNVCIGGVTDYITVCPDEKRVSREQCAEYFSVELLPSADILTNSFNIPETRTMLFNRLAQRDITSIDMHIKGDDEVTTVHKYILPYDSEDGTGYGCNKYCRVTVGMLGGIEICVSRE